MTLLTSFRLALALGLGGLVVAACGSSDSGSGTEANTSATCGNGTIEGSEACDGTNFAGKTCASVTAGARSGGSLSCSNTCTIVDTGCTGTTSGTGGQGGSGNTPGTGGGPTGSGGRAGADAGAH